MPDHDFSSKQYLIVDDFSDMRAVLRSILQSLGATRIDQAANGAEAIDQMQRRRFDAILCDYNLGPGQDGQQVLEEARHRGFIGVDTVFIMVTAETTRDMVMGAVEYTPDSYLGKPVTKELLRTRLGKLFERKADLRAVNTALKAADYPLALAELDRRIAAAPKHLADLIKLKAEVCLKAGDYAGARAIYEQALATRDQPWAQLGRGIALYHQQDHAAALAVFQALVQHDRHLIVAYDWQAKAQVALEALEAAEATLLEAARISPRGLQRQQRIGELALANGHGEVAEAAFDRAVQLAAHSCLNHPGLLGGLAQSKSANGKYAEAEKVLGTLDAAFADHAETAFVRASATAAIRSHQGDRVGAQAALAQAEAALQDLGANADPRVASEWAAIQQRVVAAEEADARLEQLIANNHDDEAFLDQLRQECPAGIDPARLEAKIQAIRDAVIESNNAGIRLIQQGAFDEAIALLQQAADGMPENATVRLNAVKAILLKLDKMGSDPNDARHLGEQVAILERIAPEHPRLAEVRTHLARHAAR